MREGNVRGGGDTGGVAVLMMANERDEWQESGD